MTKINLIFNENRNIQKEQSRLERMGLKDELAIVSDEHLLASAKPDQVYYDSQRKCGCFWSGVLDNEAVAVDPVPAAKHRQQCENVGATV